MNPYNSYENREDWHFITLPRVNSLIESAIASCNAEAFGEALHTLQDYYSHTLQGYGPKMGHAFKGGAPDIPSNNPDLYQKMLGATMNTMQRYKDKCECPK